MGGEAADDAGAFKAVDADGVTAAGTSALYVSLAPRDLVERRVRCEAARDALGSGYTAA